MNLIELNRSLVQLRLSGMAAVMENQAHLQGRQFSSFCESGIESTLPLEVSLSKL